MTQYPLSARAPSTQPSFAVEDEAIADSEDLLHKALSRVARLEMTLAATGGALHDVNNLLTVLAGNLYLMTEAVRDYPAALGKCRNARNTAERANALIRELLSSARDSDNTVNVICPARHVVALEPVLRRSIGSKCRLMVSHSDDPWPVSASAAQLESAVANLVINARDAITDRGLITVEIKNVDLSDERANTMQLAKGHYVRLSVLDNGAGIPDELLPRIAEPLVTSKPAGQGNGMGLAMVQRFVTRAGGALRVDSVVGRGTQIDLWLPRCLRPPEATANMTLPLSTLPGGDETLLLLTDDDEVRGIVEQLLNALGYTVFSASDRTAALALAKTAEIVSLVICERSSDTRGEELVWLDALHQSQPNARQLAILGSGEHGIHVAPDADAFLHRPVSIAELATSVRSALEVNR